MWLLLGFAVGILIGLFLPFQIPIEYAKYLSVAFLAALDSILGGTRAGLEKRFDSSIFLVGFLSNAILAVFLTFIGDRLGIDLYLVALITFGVRIFNNLGFIRRDLLKKPAPKENFPLFQNQQPQS